MKELQAIVAALLNPATPATVLATLVSVQGSSYRRPGARMLVLPDGSRMGSISGGCLEEDVLARAMRVHASGVAETVVYDTTSENDLVWGVGLGCHGIVRVLIEKLPPRPAWAVALAEGFATRRPTPLRVLHDGPSPARWGTRLPASGAAPHPEDKVFEQDITPPTSLIIFGAGDDARPLARMARELGWHITIADPRPAFATPARFPEADALVVAPADQLVERTRPGPGTLAAVMTHHYIHDVPLLQSLLPLRLAYLGLLGPRKRAEKIIADLTGQGAIITSEQRARLHAPVGLDLGADSPEQVALSILAEMQAALTGRDARPLRERTRPIHE